MKYMLARGWSLEKKVLMHYLVNPLGVLSSPAAEHIYMRRSSVAAAAGDPFMLPSA